MQLRHLVGVLAAEVAVVVADCTPRAPCHSADLAVRVLRDPAHLEAASSFCSSYVQSVATESVTVSTTQVLGVTATASPSTLTTTEVITSTTLVTQYSTSYSTSTRTINIAKRDGGIEQRAPDYGVLSALSRFPPKRISSACGCIVGMSAATLTETVTVATEATTVESTTTIQPMTTIVVTKTETTLKSATTTVKTVVPTLATTYDCTNAPYNFCCMNIAPWSTNSYVWGGICGYTPSDPSTLVGARCITYNPASGCPAGTLRTCCAGAVPGQCALGTNCSPRLN